jgi:hypothetical protein
MVDAENVTARLLTNKYKIIIKYIKSSTSKIFPLLSPWHNKTIPAAGKYWPFG